MSASAFPCLSQWQNFGFGIKICISLGNNLFAKLQKQNVADCDGSRAKEPVQQWPPLYRVQPGPGWQDGESDIVIFNLNTGHVKSYNTINNFL